MSMSIKIPAEWHLDDFSSPLPSAELFRTERGRKAWVHSSAGDSKQVEMICRLAASSTSGGPLQAVLSSGKQSVLHAAR